ncbi:hypothetical protein J2750_001881 [Methanococcoides alaskense]|uniref:Uncharacterized protein n=1 Tax=Methanococcoides alaskense TaxID=325778 RepID=A0AA90TZZ8_9EURY|nr:hypothetical protein [Methanococcoides alaskense]
MIPRIKLINMTTKQFDIEMIEGFADIMDILRNEEW